MSEGSSASFLPECVYLQVKQNDLDELTDWLKA